MIRVLVVDDQHLLRTGTAMVIGTADDLVVVGEAQDGLQALERIGALRPDVVVTDIRMPGMDGIETTRRITERFPAVKVLVLTQFDLDEHVFGALAAGASGYLLKESSGRSSARRSGRWRRAMRSWRPGRADGWSRR